MSALHDKRFPNESDAYREARNKLLAGEADLRQKIQDVANARMVLPLGGKIKEDYVFEEGSGDLSDAQNVNTVKLSELFAVGKDNLLIYNFMFGPGSGPCPMCTSFLDSMNSIAPYIKDRMSLAVVAKATLPEIRDWARKRNWENLRMLSSYGNSFNEDYFAQNESGEQDPMAHIFRRVDDGVFHFWSSELFFVPFAEDQHTRHIDMLWPLWHYFDLIPEGRGVNWFPSPSME